MKMSKIEFNPNGVIPDNGNYFGMPVEADDAALVLISAPWDATTARRNGSLLICIHLRNIQNIIYHA